MDSDYFNPGTGANSARYVQLAPSSPGQSGAKVNLRATSAVGLPGFNLYLNDGGLVGTNSLVSLLAEGTPLYANTTTIGLSITASMNDSANVTENVALQLSAMNGAAGHNFALRVLAGDAYLGVPGSVVTTGNNMLDDGQGNALFAGVVRAQAGALVAGNTVLFEGFFDANVKLQTDAGGYFQITGPSVYLLDATSGHSFQVGATLQATGVFGVYGNEPTAGMGVAPVRASGWLVSLNTNVAPTTVCTYTPTSASGQSFRVSWRLACVTASTPTLTVTYTDPNAGAQSVVLYNTAMGANTVQSGVFNLVATSASAVTVIGLDSVALGDIFATVEIEQLQ